MQKSDRRILTTHVGSLPRIPVLRDLLKQREEGVAVDNDILKLETDAAVSRVVKGQLEAGIDVGNNGEQPRVGFSTYVATRMEGFGGESPRPLSLDAEEFPDHASILNEQRRHSSRVNVTHRVEAEVRYVDLTEAEEECDQFIEISDKADGDFVERFMTAASPGIVATTMMNHYYDTHQAYIDALAHGMQLEYELIHSRGLLLQIDCPDLAMERTRFFKDKSVSEFQDMVHMHIDAINRAVANIPSDRIRLHVCWGNTNSPHIHDIPLETILPILYEAHVGALSIELANPRHQHEYKVFKSHPMPGSMILLPGVIDSTTNYVEHPEVIADRISQVVEAVGDPTRVIASVDCGFGTFAGSEAVAPSVVWSKLSALREGAQIATERFW